MQEVLRVLHEEVVVRQREPSEDDAPARRCPWRRAGASSIARARQLPYHVAARGPVTEPNRGFSLDSSFSTCPAIASRTAARVGARTRRRRPLPRRQPLNTAN
jgi:hypothetical protein